jgi:nitroreductase
MSSSDVFDVIDRRASIRKYEDRPVPDHVVEQVAAAGQRAPFTGQLYSMIFTSDPEKRQAVGEWLGALPRKAPVFMLFCVDFRRLNRFVTRYGREVMMATSGLLWWGIQDVCYVAENIVLAAEAKGLGTCFLGGTPWVSEPLCRIFSIPQQVFPVVGLVMGYPAEAPEPRSRIPLRFVLHKDAYRDLTEDDVSGALAVMDAGLLREGYFHKYQSGFRTLKGEPVLSDQEYGYGEHTARKFSSIWETFGYDLKQNLLKQGIEL